MVHKPPIVESIISFSFVSKSVYRVASLLSLVFAVICQVSLLDLAFFVWEGYFYYYFFEWTMVVCVKECIYSIHLSW